jgi:hypothetical protein
MGTLKNILTIFVVILWAGGIIGGIVLALAAKSPIMVAAIIVLGVLAFPTVKRLLTTDGAKK